ncbi:MAG: tripartite tricarboxylate transporter TctB family protein [Alphaproteobacteria bacterium]|nr:tripartite tricarboxylate transporter TctB family protein [Alphaproteobacteria bacterium]
MRKTHIYASLVISFVSLIFLLWLIPAQTSPPDSHLDLAPKFIPNLAIIVCLGLAALLGLTAFFSPKKDDELHEEFGEEASGMGWPEFQNLGLWILASGAAWMGTVHVGFEPAMIVFLAAVLIYAGMRNYWLTAIIAILTPIILSQFAWYVFSTEMPGFWRS